MSNVMLAGAKIRPREKAPNIFEILLPRMLPRASGDWCCDIEATTTTNYPMSVTTCRMLADPTYLFPFRSSSQQCYQRRWDSQSTRHLRRVIDEFVGSKLQHKQPSDEGRDVEEHIIEVQHFEDSGLEISNRRRSRVHKEECVTRAATKRRRWHGCCKKELLNGLFSLRHQDNCVE